MKTKDQDGPFIYGGPGQIADHETENRTATYSFVKSITSRIVRIGMIVVLYVDVIRKSVCRGGASWLCKNSALEHFLFNLA